MKCPHGTEMKEIADQLGYAVWWCPGCGHVVLEDARRVEGFRSPPDKEQPDETCVMLSPTGCCGKSPVNHLASALRTLPEWRKTASDSERNAAVGLVKGLVAEMLREMPDTGGGE